MMKKKRTETDGEYLRNLGEQEEIFATEQELKKRNWQETAKRD